MILDLSCSISNDSLVFPGHPEVSFKKLETRSGSIIDEICIGSHTGTHIDAPSHFIPSGKSTSEIELDNLIAETYILDFSLTPDINLIGKQLLSERDSFIKPKGSVFIYTGYSNAEGRRNYESDYSALSVEGAEYLLEKEISVIGIDSPSIGVNSDEGVDVHKLLLGNGVIIIERLVNLELIKSQPVKTIALPIKLKNCTGAPCRVIALEE